VRHAARNDSSAAVWCEHVEPLDRTEILLQSWRSELGVGATRWVLDQQPLSIALWGARHPDQLDPVAEVMGWKLDADALAEIDHIVSDCIHDPVGPEFMAPPTRLPA
jgi:aryl-alcohol dehydrogenase-like predicted oxidoreductase